MAWRPHAKVESLLYNVVCKSVSYPYIHDPLNDPLWRIDRAVRDALRQARFT